MELQEYLPKLLFIFCISAESGLDCIDLGSAGLCCVVQSKEIMLYPFVYLAHLLDMVVLCLRANKRE